MKMNEARLSQKIIQIVKYRGLYGTKLSDRFQVGLPDIYISGGRWIEVKNTFCKTSADIWAMTSPEQRNYARRLMEAGDKVWLLTGIQFKEGQYYHMIPFIELKERVYVDMCHPSLEYLLGQI